MRLIGQILILLTLLSALAACAARTRVHVFALGFDEHTVATVSEALTAQGFDARPNPLPVPVGMNRHTIVYPAIVQDFATVEAIESVLADAGFADARLILESEANHHYSTENIGVYLIHPDREVVAASRDIDPYRLGGANATRLTNNYYSECAEGSEAQSELNLYPSGLALLEEFIWNERRGREVSVVHDGQWQADDRTVTVELFDLGELRYTIREHSGRNWVGPYQGLTLANVDSNVSIEACDYTYLDYQN